MPRPRKPVLISLLAAGSLLGPLLAVAPASAAARPAMRPQHRHHRVGLAAAATSSSSTIDVVVPLHVPASAQHEVALLAHSQLSRTTRLARLRALAPAPESALTVERWARAHGFAVTSQTPWSVALRGRAGALAKAFGTSLGSTTFQGKSFVTPRAAAHLPAVLAGVADGVVGLDTRPLFRSHDVYAGGDLQVLTSTPVRGRTAGAGAVVATVNLSGWHPTDLTTYRHAAFGSSDVAPATTNVVVGTGHVAATVLEDDFGIEPEVALDAETIAGVAPSAQQRMYFGGNSSADYLLVLQQMYADLTSGVASAHFDAASSSWGACELALDSATLNAMRSAISGITAAGATFFAASGDSGAYDCGDGMTAAVDFPASAESTVAVGGTSVTGQAPSYASTAWDGSGGGCSQVVPAPARQLAAGSPCAGRAVPDVASLADPATGVWVYDATDEWMPVGGTSLAAPTTAAGYVDMLSDAHKLGAAGNFLDLVYAHPSALTDVTTGNNGLYRAQTGYDLVTGLGTPRWTGLEAALTATTEAAPTGYNEPLFAVDPTSDPTTAYLDGTDYNGNTVSGFVPNGEPATGYDVTSGTASGCAGLPATPPSTAALPPSSSDSSDIELWATIATSDPAVPSGCLSVSRPVVLDTRAPSMGIPVVTYTGTTSPTYRFAWSATDAAPSSRILGFEGGVQDLTAGRMVAVFFTTGRVFPYATAPALPVVAGHLYQVTVYGVDGAFNNAYSTQTWRAPYDDRSVTLSSGWTRVTASPDYLGSHVASAHAGSYYAVRFTGKTLTVGVLKGRYGGYADVYVDNVKKFRFSLYASSTSYRQLVRLTAFTTAGTHSVVVKVVGAHQTGSYGSYVYLDSFSVV